MQMETRHHFPPKSLSKWPMATGLKADALGMGCSALCLQEVQAWLSLWAKPPSGSARLQPSCWRRQNSTSGNVSLGRRGW